MKPILPLALLASFALTACQSAPVPVASYEPKPSIADIKACVAEYRPEAVMGTYEAYAAGCYEFAPLRFEGAQS